MNDLYLNRFISEHFKVFRATISKDLTLIPSIEFTRYFELPDELSGQKVHINDLLPETFGYEEIILNLLQSGENEFRIPNIARTMKRGDIFFNILLVHVPFYKDLNLFIEDTTDSMSSERELQQSRNEIILLNNEISERNIELEQGNMEMKMLQHDLRQLNHKLEKKVTERTLELEINLNKTKRVFEQTVKALSLALEKRDPYTAGHQDRVSELAAAIAAKLSFDQNTIEGIKIASRLHDLGKIYVPSEFLTRPGKLTEEEFNVIKMHPVIGFDILKDIEFPWPVAAIVLQHHERINGSGYPYGLTGDEIMKEAQILAVSDTVETIATDRPYRKTLGLDYALELIQKERGISLAPDVVDACLELFFEDDFILKSMELHIEGII